MGDSNLPPRPWNRASSAMPTANGTHPVYIVDATGRKIAAIWGKSEERESIADAIIGLINRE